MIEAVSIHSIGNKSSQGTLRLSKKPVLPGETLQDALLTYFLSSFKTEEQYQFYHTVGLPMNVVYNCIARIFEDPDCLHDQSVDLARHLYHQSTHPKIREGELYIAYCKECNFNGETFDAVGLFKSENKDTYLQVEPAVHGFELQSRQGININKPDKGCLVFNTLKEEGYRLFIVDNTNKGNEAQYWKDEFLSVQMVSNDFSQTSQFLGIAKQFVTTRLDEDFAMAKADKIDLLNRSVDYFKTHGQFDKEDFEREVFFHPNVIESFQKFDADYRREHAVDLSDTFNISAQAVKRQARAFKSVLKLDKNFHVYIHGNRELIEQGVDENGRKYYKLYYDQEA